MIKVVSEIQCPICGAKEQHADKKHIQIRAMKYCDKGKWYSQCLVCSGGYDKPDGMFTEKNHQADKGWF